MKLRGKKATEILGQVVLWIILIASLLIFSVPFLFMITNSFEEFSYVLPYPPKLFPTRLDFSAYQHILGMDIFPTALKNSVINTVITVMISVFVSTLSAYGFARIRFPGRDKLFAVYMFTLMVPGFLNIIPQFLVLLPARAAGLPNGLIGTRAGLILVYVATNVCGHTFFLRNFFRSLPNSLAESVLLDGGGHKDIFFRVMLPLSAPGRRHHDDFCVPGLLGGVLYGEGPCRRKRKDDHLPAAAAAAERTIRNAVGVGFCRVDPGADPRDRSVCDFSAENGRRRADAGGRERINECKRSPVTLTKRSISPASRYAWTCRRIPYRRR